MVKSSTLLLFLAHATAMRIGQVDEVGNADMTVNGDSPFTCPTECLECCSKLRSLTGAFGGYFRRRNVFKCITRTADDVMSIPGYECDQPQTRPSHVGQSKRSCQFTSEERSSGAFRDLRRCRDTSVKTFREFIGPTSCSATHIGRTVSRVSGHHFGVFSAADLLILRETHAITGGASRYVANNIASAGLLPAGMTSRDLENEIAERFATDMQSKRLNRYVMGVWAGAMGGLAEYNMSKASSSVRVFQKVEIAGWPNRVISMETPEDDMKQIELMGGGFACAIERLRGLPLEDDMGDDENQWGPGCADPAELNQWFFDRFGIYQRPFHFVVPQNELTSDRTLEQLVFQNAGAHRLELIQSPDGHDAVFINPIGTGGCPSDGLPAHGCPYCMRSALAALPEAQRSASRFAVRQEGLFDDAPRRPGLAKWGSNAFFDGEGHLLALQYEGQTLTAEQGSELWEYFKFVFRSSLLSSITAFDHLVATHILVAETLAITTSENLGPNNLLRSMLNPHIVGSMQINLAAGTNLFPTGSLVHRASPFADRAYAADDGRGTGVLWGKSVVLRYTRFADVYMAYRSHFEELRSEGVQMPELPFFEDGVLIYTEIQRYVERAIELIYGAGQVRCSAALLTDHEAQRFIRHFWSLTDPATPDFWPHEFRRPTCHALTELLSESIFTVTGWHRHVGTVADFFRDTRLASTVWKEGETNARPAQAIMMMLLAQSTNAILPKLSDDLSEVIYEDHDLLAENFRTFHSRMLEIQEEIDSRNVVRLQRNDVPYHQMEPTSIEYGVEV